MYKSASKKFASNENLIFASLDASKIKPQSIGIEVSHFSLVNRYSHELDIRFQVTGIPSFKAFLKGDEDEVEFWGDDNEQDIVNFIEEIAISNYE